MKYIFALIVLSCSCFADQILYNPSAYIKICGNQMSNGSLLVTQAEIEILRKKGLTGWNLAATMESRHSWLGEIHAFTPHELAVIAGCPKADIYVLIGKGDAPKSGKLVADVFDETTRKRVRIWRQQ